jgi:zinc protease
MTAMQGVALSTLEGAVDAEIDRVRASGVSEDEVARARRQLRARFVFETDSVTNIAHQLGYFETVTGPGFFDMVHSRVAKVTAADVSDVARRRLRAQNRTVGWFQPEQKAG